MRIPTSNNSTMLRCSSEDKVSYCDPLCQAKKNKDNPFLMERMLMRHTLLSSDKRLYGLTFWVGCWNSHRCFWSPVRYFTTSHISLLSFCFKKFGSIRADVIEQMRFKQRLRVIQTIEDTTKRNVVRKSCDQTALILARVKWDRGMAKRPTRRWRHWPI